ncbi:MAG: c-type cytochrome, partial [Acidobacteria bacterium]|nr:c-type cytochrome [Acidobacteriota bacterium]
MNWPRVSRFSFGLVNLPAAVALLLASAGTMPGQTPAPTATAQPITTAQQIANTQQTYEKLCGGCHGADARGTQQGPGLAGNPGVRRRSAANLRNVIQKGIPAAGMPGFDLPAATLDALVALVASLNAVAAESPVAGDRAAGQAYFKGPGQCGTCHMVHGSGAAIGPDLTNIARELTVDQLREALLNPSSRIAPGYGLVNVELRSGGQLRGFARNRTRFHLALQDLRGQLHPLSLDKTARLTDEKASLMPAVKASPAQVQDLIAYLSSLTGVKSVAANTPGPIVTAPAAHTGGVDFSSILNPPPGDWLTYNGQLSGNRYSPLKQINAANVQQLRLKWSFSIPLWTQFLPDTPYFRENMRYFGLETVPLVTGGIMYATGPNQVFALD